jgi:radical SAM family uncharacterized protein/radical SAM-linked protein
MNLSETIETILPLVNKPSRYLGNEFHVVRKDPKSVDVQWLLVLPEVYEIGMSHWGLKILYDILNRRDDTLAERAYCPWLDMEAMMRRHAIPFFSLESHRPARAFDLIGFSLQYEMTCTNILTCLDLAGIPLWARERSDEDPLVIGGGPCVSNPEPLADFFDLFLIGDGEDAVHRITQVVHETADRPRKQRLKALAQIPGVYAPFFYEARYADGNFTGIACLDPQLPVRPTRTFVTDLEEVPYPEKPIVPLQDIVQDRLSVEVLRGCTQGCRFCQAGYFYRPLRERSPQKVFDLTERGLRSTGWDGVSLVSLSTADYTQIEPLAEAINRRFAGEKISIALPSLRADRFGVGIAERIREVKKTGFTFAPEAGSERLRKAINKLISDEELFASARIAFERGWRLIKLYMMIGLPTESWDDIEAIITFTERVAEIGREIGPGCRVNLSLGAFVPKSHTPFQWDRFEELDELQEKLTYIKQKLPKRWARLKWNDLEMSHIEAMLSRGDRRLSQVIHRVWQLGSRFDGWSEHFSHDRWTQALDECGLSASMFTGRFELEQPLPWDHIDIGIRKKWLILERKKTDELEETPDCRYGDCVACGIEGMPNDTRLTPNLDEEAARALVDRAAAGAVSRSGRGVLWPVRIRYAKDDRARFLSHLETGTILARAFRMARIPVAHTQGHSPHPKLHFGPALPVGVASDVELFDVELESPPRKDLPEKLNRVLPEGFRVLGARSLPTHVGKKKRSISSLARLGEYSVDLRGLPEPRCEQIAEALAHFTGANEWIVRKRGHRPPNGSAPRSGAGIDERLLMHSTDPEVKTIDLKKACVQIGWDRGTSHLTMTLRIQDPNGHTTNPARVLGSVFALTPEEQVRCLVRRTGILREDGLAIWQ